MRDRFPEEHHVFASAVPEIRAHFENAAKHDSSHFMFLESIADDLRQAERHIEQHGPTGQHVERARFNLLSAAEGRDYYPNIGHEFDVALDICLAHKRKLSGPGAF